jgi:hypothetical protein
MYTNRRRARPRVSDDSVMRDAMMEMRDLRISILHVGASRMRLSHIVSWSHFVGSYICNSGSYVKKEILRGSVCNQLLSLEFSSHYIPTFLSLLITTTKHLCSDGGGPTLGTSILWPVSTVAPRWCHRTARRCCGLSSNGLGWHRILARCYHDILVAVTSHRGCHTSLLLLRATIAMVIRLISPRPVAIATKRVIAATSWLVPPR